MIRRRIRYLLGINLSLCLFVIVGGFVALDEELLAEDNMRGYLPIVVGGSRGELPTVTVTPTPMSSPTATMATATVTATATASPTASSTKIPSPTATVTTTPTATQTSVPTITSSPTPTLEPNPTPSGDNVTCAQTGPVQICAWVSDGTPKQYTNVTAFGRLITAGMPVSGAPMHSVWHYKTVTTTEDCETDKKGIGKCTRSIHSATPGFEVDVIVEITHQGTTYQTQTWFVPEE